MHGRRRLCLVFPPKGLKYTPPKLTCGGCAAARPIQTMIVASWAPTAKMINAPQQNTLSQQMQFQLLKPTLCSQRFLQLTAEALNVKGAPHKTYKTQYQVDGNRGQIDAKINRCQDRKQQSEIITKSSNKEILSPMPGTFYSASSPDATPFIKDGDKVSKGDSLCIIEAMKIMNEIEAEESGTIVKFLVDDGSAVDYNQPLFLIDPS